MTGSWPLGLAFLLGVIVGHYFSTVQPPVRPFGAVHMTAGHNALRGSGPGQKRPPPEGHGPKD
jgi:hypothetical protein